MRLDGKPKAALSINHLKPSLKSFGRWSLITGQLPSDPARAIEIKRANRKSPNSLTEQERKRMLKEVAGHKGASAYRDLMILELFLNTGIRLSELVNLNIRDIDLDGKRINIKAKGGNAEKRFINTSIRTMLRRYLRRRSDTFCNSTAVFLSNRGERISNRQVQLRFRKWLSWSGIDRQGLSVHSLRHTFGTRLYRKTRDIVLVGKAMGHRTVEATRIYVHEDTEAIEEALETF